MKLSEEQIQQLFKFTRQHYVEYYDIQLELVDHLANDIEQIWKENPTLSFEQARDTSFKKFGIFGFLDVVQQRSSSLEWKYWKMVWNIFIEFFKIPQIVVTLSIFMGLFLIFKYFPSGLSYYALLIIGIILGYFRLNHLNKIKKQRFEKTQKKWLLEEYIFSLSSNLILFNLFFQFIFHFDYQIVYHLNFQLLMAFIVTLVIIFTYITLYFLPDKIEEILTDQYPEYKLVS